MEAARTAADRGHQVVLFEKSEKLGGTLNMAVAPEFKKDLKAYLNWAIRMTAKHPGIKIRLATEATPEIIKAENPDAIVVAVGAEPNIPPIPGLDGENVVWVGDLEAGNVQVGDNILVAGGGLTGCEVALDLARKGKKVSIVEMVSEKEMIDVSPIPMTALIKLLKEEGVTILANHKLLRVNVNTAVVEGKDGIKNIAFDTLIVSLGVKPKIEEASKFADLADEVYYVGDCTTNRGNLYTSTTSGFNAGMDI
jgi:Pyridine nucleotide-disulphide oxidoreductase.